VTLFTPNQIAAGGPIPPNYTLVQKEAECIAGQKKSARGLLEQAIDQAITTLPAFVNMCRSDQSRRDFQYQYSEDFALGVAIERIITSFETVFRIANGRTFNPDEMAEIFNVIHGRMHLIRAALFNAG
jgi:hypothetical protein